MKHNFVGSSIDKSKCNTCTRSAMDHTNCAKCESCENTGNCDLIEGLLLCASCEIEHMRSYREKLATADEIIAEARKLDKTIIYNGDFFNARVMAHKEILGALNADETLSDQTRTVKFQQYLLEKYQHSKKAVFELDKQKHDEIIDQLAISETLRGLGEKITKEVSERIKELDANYTPIKNNSVIAKLPKKNLSPFERIVQQLAVSSGMTLEQARQKLIDGGMSMAKKN